MTSASTGTLGSLPRAVALAALAAVAAAALPTVPARAQVDGPSSPARAPAPRIRVRSDTVIRWTPRYVFTVDDTQLDPSVGYWRTIDELPIYQRLSLDATDLVDGHVDVHMSGWGAVDLTFDDEGGIVAGDFAQAYVRGDYGPAAAWGGRRFLSWGLPGGLHLDGGGLELRTRCGLMAEAIVGRPVTPRVRNLVGASSDFTLDTVAWGGRVGFADPRRGGVAAAYVERWGDGIPERTVTADATWRPFDRLDLGGSVALDLGDGVGVSQATAEVSYLASDELALDLFYTHRDPRRMLPSWSILSVFATSVYDEAALGGTWRVDRGVALRAEAGLRHFDHPDEAQLAGDEPEWGYRAELSLRGLPIDDGVQYRVMVSRRDDGTIAYNLADAGVSFRVWQALVLALQGTVAIDDEGENDSALARATLEYPVGDGWAVAGTIDWARSPIAASELRGLVRATWRADSRGGLR